MTKPEQLAPLERPEVVAWQYRVTAGPQTGWSHWYPGKGEEFERSYAVERRPLMTVAQHDRIVGALRAEIKDADGLAKMLGDLLREITIAIRGPEPELTRYGYPDLPQRVKTLVEERNAAQARVAELKEQEPVAFRLLNQFGEVMTEWQDGTPPEKFADLCGNPVTDVRVEVAYGAPVAQAGQVPEGYVLAPLEPTTEMVDAGMAVDIGLYESHFDETWAIYQSMLAAAPAQGGC